MKTGIYLSHKNFLNLIICLFVVLMAASGCSPNSHKEQKERPDSESMLIISGNGINQELALSLNDMLELPDARFEHVYSIINNWPSKKLYAARGIKVDAVLKTAGIYDDAKIISVSGKDGYECSFTREQLLETKRYYFPGLLTGDPDDAQAVEPIIAYEYKEDSDELGEARPDSFCLIIPQANINEQTNHVFVKGINRITVSREDPGKWEAPSVFPAASKLVKGDTVRLQHKDIGKVKLYYTTDGSIPSESSTLYNPSTYQPELNKAIVVDKDMSIKVLVKGFGKHDSDISEFHYQIQ